MPPRGVVSIVVEALKPLRRFIAFFWFYGATSSRSACVRRSVI